MTDEYLAERDLLFRPAREEDSGLLFAWRNDPETRKNSLSGDLVSWQDHQRWFQKTLEHTQVKLYVALSPTPVGTLRFNLSESPLSSWEMSWTINPQCRGKGWGKALVAGGVHLFKQSAPLNVPLMAKILEHNLPSKKIAAQAGLRFSHQEDNVEIWKLTVDKF